jgi:glycosyltransferase involved in cell wall biosynthesis
MEEYNLSMSQLVDAIIVHQVSMKEALVRQGVNEELIHVIPHGTKILKQVNKTEAMKKLGLPENGKIILSFGFFGKLKNKELIVEALPEVLEKVPNAYIFFSGHIRDWVQEDLETRKLYEEKAKELGVRDHVIFANRFIPNEEIHLVFGSSDVVVFPYFQKFLSASGSLHLAIGSFKPVVVSKTPKFEEVPRNISDNLIFDHNDPSELAKVLVRIMDDNNFKESMISKIKSYAIKTSWDVVATTHMQVYKVLE